MALKLDLIKTEQNFEGLLVFKDGYWKIDNVLFSKELAVATLGIYSLDKSDKIATRVFSFIPTLSNQNTLVETYIYLKTLPEFADAIDC